MTPAQASASATAAQSWRTQPASKLAMRLREQGIDAETALGTAAGVVALEVAARIAERLNEQREA